MIEEIQEDRRVQLLVVCVAVSIILIFTRGISTGLDLRGGSMIQIQMERALMPEEMDQVIRTMDQRLRGGLGVKDVKVAPWGNEFVIIKVAGVSPAELEKLLGKPGKLTVRIGNLTAFTGDGLKRIDPYSKETRSGSWGVPFTISDKAAERFRDTAIATKFDRVYMYMDEGTNIRIKSERDIPAESLENISFKFKTSSVKSNLTGVITTVEIDAPLEELDVNRIRELINATAQDAGIKSIDFERTGLVNSAPISQSLIEELAAGRVVKSLILETGRGNEGLEEAKRIEAILRSGALPIKVNIASRYRIPPALGKDFTRNAILAGVFAFIGVSSIIYIRYREPKIVVPVLAMSLSEITIILGIASLIRWDIDLPAIAGIIAAVGTGVDSEVVIIDEIFMEREHSLRRNIKDAFFIVMCSYLTLVAAMIPLFKTAMGMVMGFAVTTIIGATVGILITRPTFARIIGYILKQ